MSLVTLSFLLTGTLTVVKLAFGLSGSWFWICAPVIFILVLLLLAKAIIGLTILSMKVHDKIHKTDTYGDFKRRERLDKLFKG